jgi:hypothetical protein
MSRSYDPLAMIPPPAAIRGRLVETEQLAARLRVLLDVSERLHPPTAERSSLPSTDEEGRHHV